MRRTPGDRKRWYTRVLREADRRLLSISSGESLFIRGSRRRKWVSRGLRLCSAGAHLVSLSKELSEGPAPAYTARETRSISTLSAGKSCQRKAGCRERAWRKRTILVLGEALRTVRTDSAPSCGLKVGIDNADKSGGKTGRHLEPVIRMAASLSFPDGDSLYGKDDPYQGEWDTVARKKATPPKTSPRASTEVRWLGLQSEIRHHGT